MRVDEHTIELAGSPVFYRNADAPGTPVLYLHGVPTSSDDFVPFLERSGGIAPDLQGFGRTSKAGNLDYTLEGEALFLESLLRELKLERIHLVGHDLGAAVGLVLAQRSPALVERLVLINALPLLPGFTWHRYARTWRRPLIGELAMGATNRRLLARALNKGTVREDVWPEERIAQIYEEFDQGTQRAILQMHRATDEPLLAAAGEHLSRLNQIPALIVWGERDPWLDSKYAAAYAAALGTGEVVTIPDAGHWPWLDDPGVIDRIAAFLR